MCAERGVSEVWAHNGLGKGKLLLPISVQDQDPDVLQPLDIVSLLKIADLTAELVEKKNEGSPSTPM